MRLVTILVIALSGLAGIPRIYAQSVFIGQLNSVGDGTNGFHIYGASLSSGYSTFPLNYGTTAALSTVNRTPAFDASGATSLGYLHVAPRSSFNLTYTPSYYRRLDSLHQQSFTENLSMSVHHGLGAKWDWQASLNGDDSDITSFLFSPAPATLVSANQSSFEDLSAASLGGQVSNPQLSGILNTPASAGPARFLVYGSRLVSATATTGLTYNKSDRLTFNFDVGASHFERFDGQGGPGVVNPRTWSERAAARMSYALSPRTYLTADADTSHTFSQYSNTYLARGILGVGRILSPRWFVDVHGGGSGVFQGSGSSSIAVINRRSYNVSGNLGFRTTSQTLMGNYGRSIFNPYGLGPQVTETYSGSWYWRRTGSPWAAYANGTRQRFLGSNPLLGNLSGWNGAAGVSRELSRQFSLTASYGYFENSALQADQSLIKLSRYAARLTLVWAPARHSVESPDTGLSNFN